MSRWRNIAARTAIDLDWKGADRLLKQVLQVLPREAAQALDGLDAAHSRPHPQQRERQPLT